MSFKTALNKLAILAVCALPVAGAYFVHQQEQLRIAEERAFAEPESAEPNLPLAVQAEVAAPKAEVQPLFELRTVQLNAPLNSYISSLLQNARLDVPAKAEVKTSILPPVVVAPPKKRVMAQAALAVLAQKKSGPMDDDRWRTLSKSQKYAFVSSYLRAMKWTCPPSGHDTAWEMEQLEGHDWSTIRRFGFTNCIANRNSTVANTPG
jgi:hypothetical protein